MILYKLPTNNEQFRNHFAKQGTSWLWQGILKCNDLVSNKGACLAVGKDLGINIWEEPWVPWLKKFISKKQDSCINPSIFVSELFEARRCSWYRNVISDTFELEFNGCHPPPFK